jgi:hypothetical protein
MAEVDIEVIAAVVEAVRELDKVNRSLDDMDKESKETGISFTELKSGLELAMGAFKAVAGAVESVVGPTIEYGKQVRDLGSFAGITAEESSRLIQVTDDLGIQFTTLRMAAKAMSENGLQPSVKNLAALADQFNAIEDPVKQSQFLVDQFGARAGPQLAYALRQGGDALRQMSKDAEATGLVVGQDFVDSTRQAELAIDSWEDSLLALKVALSQEVLPALTDFINESANVVSIHNLIKRAVDDNLLSYDELQQVQKLVYSGDQAAAMKFLTTKIEEHNNALADAADNTQDYGIRLGKIKPLQVDYNTALSDTAHDYARMGEAANNMTAALVKIGEAQDVVNQRLQQAVNAGLDGSLADAFAEYRDVLAETQPEIDKLTEDIARMNAAQGKTFTVTTEVTATIYEYELAQIKAATAAQKLAEYTGDDREEFLKLQIASDNAKDSINKIGAELGVTTQYTADYTTKLLDANSSLAELNAKQTEAEAQLRKTTAEFILQNIVLEQAPAAQLEVARALGLIDEQAYNLATRTQELTLQWDLNKNGMIDAGKESAGLANSLALLENSVVTAEMAAADGAITMEDFGTRINVYTTPALQNAKQAAIEARDAINSLQDKTITITTIFHNEGSPGMPGTGGGGTGDGYQQQSQAGALP